MSEFGRLSPDEESASRPFWSAQPRFFWFVLISSAILLPLFAFQLSEILRFGDTLASPGWYAARSSSGWIVDRVPQTGPAAGKLVRGDRILSINGDPHAERVDPHWFLAHAVPGEPYTVEVERGSKRVALQLRMSSTHVPDQRLWASIQVFVALIFLITGAMIGLAKPAEQSGRNAFISAALAGMFLLSIASTVMYQAGLKGWPLWVTLLMDCAFGIHYLYGFRFYSRFPQFMGRTGVWALLDYTITVSALGLWLLTVGSNILNGLPQSLAVAFADTHARLASILQLGTDTSVRKFFGAAVNLSVAVACIRNFRMIPEGDQRRRLRWAFFGVIGAQLPAFAIMAAWYVVTVLPGGIDLTGLRFIFSRTVNTVVVFMPLTMAYAILKHRVLGIRVVVRMGIQHLLATNVLRVLLALPLIAVAYELVSDRNKTVSELLFRGSAKWNLALIVGLAISNRYRQQLTTAIDKYFFRDSYSQEGILTLLADSIKKLDSVEEIAALLSAEVTKALHPEWVAVLYRQTRHSGLSLAYASHESSRHLTHAENSGILEKLEEAGGATLWSTLRRVSPQSERISFDRAGANLLVPILGTETKPLGILVLGEKKSEEPYTAKDRALLERIGHEIGIVYENLELRGLVRRERQVQADVLARVAKDDVSLVKECPACGRCYDSSAQTCDKDGVELSLSLPVERTIEGRYQLRRLIGKGGMGAVYEASDLRLNRSVAVKVMMGRLFGNTAAMRRFSREAQASARLVHPNIVRLYDYGELAAEGAFLVMEHVRGVTWRRLLSDHGSLPPDVSAALFEQLLSGIEAAHSARIIHRDLKPENVLVQGSGAEVVVKILDFGLAKVRSADLADSISMTAPGVAMGTLGYMSPEQYIGGDVDERSDIYSIGVMVLETLTGKLQLKAYVFHSQIGELVQRRFDFPGATPEHRRLANCVTRSVAIQCADRYSTIRELWEELLPALRACQPLPEVARAAAAASSSPDDPEITATYVT